jgi:5-deoxy-glucuronate isomerase
MNPSIVRSAAASPDPDGTILSVTPETAGWRYVSFKVWKLTPGQTIEEDSLDEEVGLVVLRGSHTWCTFHHAVGMR